MTKLLRIEDIEEFQKAHQIPRSAISDKVLGNIRQLDEKKELETYLREILADKTETPHNPVEVADILTTVSVQGESLLAAFVNKGRGFRSVTAKNTTHQITRLRNIRGLRLIVLVGVGDIQDDIKIELTRTAEDADADYAIFDAVDVARLFIAYHKICPSDGVSFIDGKCTVCGHETNGPISLVFSVDEEPEHIILEDRNVSHGSVKRYVADVWTDRHYHKRVLRKLITKVIGELRYMGGQLDRAESRSEKQSAAVVWIFLYFNEFERQVHNWYCRAQWISPKLPKNQRPMEWKGERLGEIVIDWRKDYEQQREFWLKRKGSKQEWIEKIGMVLPQMQYLIKQAHSRLRSYTREQLKNQLLERDLSQLEQIALEVSLNAGGDKIPPIDCKKCHQLFQNMAAQCHNVFLPFATWGKPIDRSPVEKLQLMRHALQAYEEQEKLFELEWRNLRNG